MALPSGTQFVGFADTVNLKERKSSVVNAETGVYTADDIRGYKVYTAIISQHGEGSNLSTISAGSLEKGVSYSFSSTNEPGWDFTNVGGPKYPSVSAFVATENVDPLNWSDAVLLSNKSAPIVLSELENTLGPIYWAYEEDGVYSINADYSLFTANKTYTNLQLWGDDGSTNRIGAVNWQNDTVLFLYNGSYSGLGTAVIGSVSDPASWLTSIEIRVYN